MPSFFLSVPFPIFFSVTPCSELHSQSLLCLMLTLHLNKTVLGEFWIWPGIFMEKLLLFPWRLETSLSSARDMLGRDITFSLAMKVLSGLELASCPSPCFSLLTWGHMGVEGKVGASIFSTHTPPQHVLTQLPAPARTQARLRLHQATFYSAPAHRKLMGLDHEPVETV